MQTMLGLRHSRVARPAGAHQAQARRRLVRPRSSSHAPGAGAPAAAAAAGARDGAAAASRPPQWASYVSRRINLELAVEEAVEGAFRGPGAPQGAAQQQQHEWQPELAVVFLSGYSDHAGLVRELRSRVPSLKHIVGSTGYGVIGSTEEGPEEIEHAPALSLALSSLPGCRVSVTHVTGQQLPDGDASPEAWARMLGVRLHSDDPTSFILLAEPEFSQLQELTAGLDFAFPAANKIGGLISAGKLSPVRAMFAWSSDQEKQQQQQQQQQQQEQGQDQQQQQQLGGEAGAGRFPSLLRTGAVVLSLQGPVEMELLIAQGCRPLSASVYVVDEVADGGPVVLRLRDERSRQLTPVEALQRELEQVTSSRPELLALLRNMALGLVPEVLRVADGPAPEPHDFLIRGMALSKAGFMIVGDAVRVGQRVRFMVRDREGAQQDLQSHCLAYKRRELAATLGSSLGASLGEPPAGAPTPPPPPAAAAAAAAAAGPAAPDAQGEEQPQQQQQQQQDPQQQQDLQQQQQQQPKPPGRRQQAFGMLLFSCNGRGMNLYDEPSWDSRTLAAYIPVPCNGFMCNGEIGSIGGATHLHGFTCAAAVLRAVEPAAGGAGASSGSGRRRSSSSSSGAIDGSGAEAADGSPSQSEGQRDA